MLLLIFAMICLLLVLQLAHMKKTNQESESFQTFRERTDSFLNRVNSILK